MNNLAGKTLWRNMSDNPAVMFEIIAHDLDGDKQDDLLGVSGNGSVYAWKSDGKLLWKFTTPEISCLSEIAVVGEDDETRILQEVIISKYMSWIQTEISCLLSLLKEQSVFLMQDTLFRMVRKICSFLHTVMTNSGLNIWGL